MEKVGGIRVIEAEKNESLKLLTCVFFCFLYFWYMPNPNARQARWVVFWDDGLNTNIDGGEGGKGVPCWLGKAGYVPNRINFPTLMHPLGGWVPSAQCC